MPLCFSISSQILIAQDDCSGFGEENLLVCDHALSSCEEPTTPTSSTIIQDIMALWDVGLATMAYFDFDFKDTSKQNTSAMRFPGFSHNSPFDPTIVATYSPVFMKNTKIMTHISPAPARLLHVLKRFSRCPAKGPSYTILDASDEYPNTTGILSARKQVLDLLKDLFALQLSDLHICVMSRPEVDMQAVLSP